MPNKQLFLSRQFLTISLVLILTSGAFAQISVSGKITDATTGEGLISANITVEGTDDGTFTDIEGNYQLTCAADATLLISYAGFESQTIVVDGRTTIDVALTEGKLLDEVVVIGYGEVKKEDLTGAIQTVDSKDFNKGVVTSAQQMLAGKVAGVSVTVGGDPGAGATIRIRGESSIRASNDPLYVVDGVPYDFGGVGGSRNPLNVINPTDIATITVLKDASATAIYGNRASGGVILITTKTGRIGTGWKVNYSGKASLSNTVGRVDVLDADEFRSLVTDRFGEESDQFALLGNASTDWQDEIYQQAFGMEHTVGLSGGIGNVPIRASFGLSDLDGVLRTEEFNRYTANININPRLLDNKLQLNFGLKASRVENLFANRGAIGAAASFDPTQPIIDPQGNEFGNYFAWLKPSDRSTVVGLSDANPIALLEQSRDETTVNRLVTSFSADYRMPFLPALRANINVAYDYSQGEGTNFTDSIAAHSNTGFFSEFSGERKNSLLEFYLNYKQDISSRAKLDLMAGYSYQRFEEEGRARSEELTTKLVVADTSAQELVLIGLFARANLVWNEDLMLTASIRRDGTSRFSPDNRWGLFPSAAIAYRLVDNDKDYLNRLKVRASWGITGQENIGLYYAYQGLYTESQVTARYQFGDRFFFTQRPNGYDQFIRWEETTTLNVGMDFSLVKDRISGTLDFYKRDTRDILNDIPVSAGANLTNFLTTNVGNLTNRGVELGLWITPVKNDKVTWELSTNAALNSNEVVKLTAIDDPDYIGILTGGIAGGVGSNIQIHSVGFPLRSFFVFEQAYDDEGNIIPGEYVDRNGDEVINEADKYRFENPAPDVVLGLTSNLNVGNFDFSFAGRANLGNYVYNNIKTDGGFLGRVNRISDALSNLHRSGVDNQVENQSQVTFSDHFVEKASFFRMDHITMGYKFEDGLFDYLRLYATVQNPFIITQYDGLDPEVFGGIDNNLYPRSRMFVLGVDINFN